MITFTVTGFVGAVWLGLKVLLGRYLSPLLVTVLLGPLPAHAIPCWMLKQAVAQYGAAAVEAWARANDVSDKAIQKVKRCFR